MGVEFKNDDLVWQPGRPESRGLVFEVRDYGVEVWVRPIDPRFPVYYTYFDQLEKLTVLDRIVFDAL